MHSLFTCFIINTRNINIFLFKESNKLIILKIRKVIKKSIISSE